MAGKKRIPYPDPVEQTNTPSNCPFDAALGKRNNVIGARLRQARTMKKMSLEKVAAGLADYHIYVKLGAVAKWEKGDNDPNPYQLFSLCHMLGIYDLMDYFTQGHQEDEQLDEVGLRKLREYRDDLVATGKYHPKKEEDTMVQVRVETIAVAAGLGNPLDDDHYEVEEFPASKVPEGTDYAVRVSGDSMMPYYQDGQYVFIQQCESLNHDEIGIFSLDGNAYVKKYTEKAPKEDELEQYTTSEGVIRPKVVLVSTNPAYAPIPVLPTSNFHIFGRVLN